MELDRESLVAAVEAEGRGVDLAGAVVHAGWENVALETRDGWILRFPRPHVNFERELAILARLAGRLPAQIPNVEWTGRHTRFAAYRKLEGAAFDLEAYDRATAGERDRLAASLAAFLAAMHHALTDDEVAELGIPDLTAAGNDAPRPFEKLAPDVKAYAHDLLDEADALRVNRKPTVVLHNDFHFFNLVLTTPVGEVKGVWDFSCVATGDPSDDLRYISGDSTDLLHRIARQYEQATGTPIDTRAAVLAGRIERIFDAIELGTADQLPARVATWRDADGSAS
jgi:aminoglycoside phosphotransferase (APT) family kinase protein